ncbi:MAG: ABC transporter substrate-binding protein [Pseudomonadota bacterium]
MPLTTPSGFFLARAGHLIRTALIFLALLGILWPEIGRAGQTVTDALGRKVDIDLPIERIVVLNSDALEVLRILGAQDKVAGVFSGLAEERAFWGDLAMRPAVGRWNDPDLEAVSALDPDLVIAYGYTPGPFLEDRLKALGIQVLRLDLFRIETLEKEVDCLGNLLGRKTEASRFVEWHNRYMARVMRTTAGITEKPSVYMESYSEFQTSSRGSGSQVMCDLAGGNNIAADLGVPYPRVTPEWVITQDPDIIVKTIALGSGYGNDTSGDLARCLTSIMNRPAWEHIRAVASKRVYVMDSTIWTGPRAVIGMAFMARWFHPDQYTDLDPEAMHREYIEAFLGLPFKGVYVISAPLRGEGQ